MELAAKCYLNELARSEVGRNRTSTGLTAKQVGNALRWWPKGEFGTSLAKEAKERGVEAL